MAKMKCIFSMCIEIVRVHCTYINSDPCECYYQNPLPETCPLDLPCTCRQRSTCLPCSSSPPASHRSNLSRRLAILKQLFLDRRRTGTCRPPFGRGQLLRGGPPLLSAPWDLTDADGGYLGGAAAGGETPTGQGGEGDDFLGTDSE